MMPRLFNDRLGTFAFRPTETGNSGAGEGNSFASLLLGVVDNGLFRPPPYSVTGYTTPYFAAFAQDSWKVTRKLTVNYGLRWEVQVPFTEVYGRMSMLDLNKPNPGASNYPGALVFYGSGDHQDRTHITLDKNTPAGRVIAARLNESCEIQSQSRVGGLHHRYSWTEAA